MFLTNYLPGVEEEDSSGVGKNGAFSDISPLKRFIEIKSTKALGRIICGAIMIAPKHFECEYGY